MTRRRRVRDRKRRNRERRKRPWTGLIGIYPNRGDGIWIAVYTA